MLTQKRLHEVLEYSQETGIFVWKINNTASHVKIGSVAGIYTNKGYVAISVDHKQYLAHRLAFLYVEGYLPEYEVDHINGICGDNRWFNLRHVSRSCNLQNCKLRTKSISGFVGVSQYKRDKKWHARIQICKKDIYLGGYDTAEEAALARCCFEDECPDWTCNHLAVNRVKLRSLGYEI